MSSKTFLWIEDRIGKSSYVFWESFLQQLCPDVEVESKKNNVTVQTGLSIYC